MTMPQDKFTWQVEIDPRNEDIEALRNRLRAYNRSQAKPTAVPPSSTPSASRLPTFTKVSATKSWASSKALVPNTANISSTNRLPRLNTTRLYKTSSLHF